MNSILMGMQKTPLTNFGMKLLFIPCLLAVMMLSSFKKTALFTDVFVQYTIVPSWVDLEGTEYIDFWIDVLDENYAQANVVDLTVNYSVFVPSNSWYAEYSKTLTGQGPFLLEQYAPYYNPTTNWYAEYSVQPGIGYTF